MDVRQAGFLRPGVELILDELEVALRFDLLRNIEPGVAQAGDDIPRRHEAVPAEKPEQHLARVPAEAAAALGQKLKQTDLVGGRPSSEEPAETAMLLRHILDETRIVAHRADLRAVADDARVLDERFPELVRLEREPRRLEAEKSGFKTRPLRFDDAPGEAGREYPLGHFRENAIIAELEQGARRAASAA